MSDSADVRVISSAAGFQLWRSPLDVFACAWRHRALIRRLAQREIAARYRASMLGMLWSVLIPLLLLAVYTFVFSVIWPNRWGTRTEGTGHFALVLFAGLILFNLFAECVNRAPTLLLENVSYVKRVVFPLEILPWVMLTSAAFNAVVSFGVLLLGYVALIGLPPATALLAPLMPLPLALLTLGAAWFLTSLGVYLRDVRQFMPVVTMILMFLSPVFYPVSALPERFRWLAAVNPLAAAMESLRDVLFWGTGPHWVAFGLQSLAAWLVAWVGFMWFMKTRKGFADVI